MDIFDQYELKQDDFDEDDFDQDDFDQDDFYQDDFDQKLEASFEQIQSSSIADDCGGIPIAITGDKLNELTRQINKLTSDPKDRFKRYVGAISYNLNERNIFPLTVDQRNKMCRIADTLPNVKYLNPTAYILGYIVTEGGKQINPAKIEKVFKKLDDLRDDSVRPPDVIRYSRFWLKIDQNI